MPDYPDNDNQVRTERRQNVEHDIGATPQEIRDATRDFQRRTEERIEARIARSDEPWQPPNREVKVESASLPIVPLTLGIAPTSPDDNQPPGQALNGVNEVVVNNNVVFVTITANLSGGILTLDVNGYDTTNCNPSP